MSVFNVNFNVLVTQLLPVRLRQAIQTAWLNCLVSPVVYVYNLFYTNRLNNLYILAHDGQVCYLQAVLNDTFDPLLRRIFIGDPMYFDPVYIYMVPESEPVFIYVAGEAPTVSIPDPVPVPLYLDSEVTAGSGGYNFIVNVPFALALTAGQIAQLQALVNRYKLPGMVYNVVMF